MPGQIFRKASRLRASSADSYLTEDIANRSLGSAPRGHWPRGTSAEGASRRWGSGRRSRRRHRSRWSRQRQRRRGRRGLGRRHRRCRDRRRSDRLRIGCRRRRGRWRRCQRMAASDARLARVGRLAAAPFARRSLRCGRARSLRSPSTSPPSSVRLFGAARLPAPRQSPGPRRLAQASARMPRWRRTSPASSACARLRPAARASAPSCPSMIRFASAFVGSTLSTLPAARAASS